MAIRIQNTVIVSDNRNVSNVDSVTANTYHGDGSNLTGISTLPVGTLQYFAGQTTTAYPGSNWLPCDGTVYSKSTYPELANILGNVVNYYAWTDTPTYTVQANNIIFDGSKFIVAGTTKSNITSNVVFSTSTDGINLTSIVTDKTLQATKDIVYSNDLNRTVGVYYSKGNTAGIVYSDDGITWNKNGIGVTWDTTDTTNIFGMKDIIANGTTNYVAVGNVGIVQTSTNGIHWATRETQTITYINKATFGTGGKVVYVANSGNVGVSTDNGENWNSYPTANATTNLYGIAYGNGLYVAAGHAGVIQSSTDAITWTVRTSGTTVSFNDVVYGNGLYVAAGGATQANIKYSTNGTTWSTATVTNLEFTPALKATYHDSGNFSFVSASGYVGASTDGMTWNPANSQTSTSVLGYEYLNNQYWYYGDGGYIASTTDGITFNRKNTGTTDTINSIAFNGTSFVATSINATTGSRILTSTDGNTWVVRQTGISKANTNTIKVVTNSGNKFAHLGGGYGGIAGSAGQTTANGMYLSSDNGVTWGLLNAGNDSVFRVINAGGKYVHVGNGGYIGTSSDMYTWYIQNSPTTSDLNSLTYGGGLYVAAGSGGAIVTSTDAITWATRTSGTTSIFNDVTYGGGVFCAVGQGGVIRTSSDGITWDSRTSGTTSSLLCVTYGSDKFLAGGSAGVCFYSTNGTTWTSVALGGTATNVNTLSYLNGLYIYGKVSAIGTSTNGLTWSSANTVGSADPVYRIHHDGTRYVAKSRNSQLFVSANANGWTTVATNIVESASQASTPAFFYDSASSTYMLMGGTGANNIWIQSAANILNATWTEKKPSPLGAGGVSNGVRIANLNNNIVFAQASNNSYVYTTTDFLSYTQKSSTTLTHTSGSDFSVCKYVNGYYFLIKQGATSGSYWTSTDLVTWTGNGALSFDVVTYDTTFFNGKYITVGAGGSGGTADVTIRYGTDPNVIPTTVTTILPATTLRMRTVANVNNKFIGTVDKGYMYSSPDGISSYYGMNFLTSPITIKTANNKVFTLGAAGQMLVSSDGIGFDRVNTDSSITHTERGIIWNGSSYIVPNHNGDIYTSTDLTSWTSKFPYSKFMECVTYGNGLFVAGGRAGNLQTSTDGLTWSARTSGTTSTINNVVYGNGVYVYGATAGTIGYSLNGIDWSSALNTTTSTITSLVFGNNLFVAAGDGFVKTSVDGRNWDFHPTEFKPTQIRYDKTKKLFYGITAAAGSTSLNALWSSRDGVKWTLNKTGGNTCFDIVFGNNTYVAVGANNGATLVPYTYNTNTQFVTPYGDNGLFIKAQ